MKKILQLILVLSVAKLCAQDKFYGTNHEFIKEQQKAILEKGNVKKIIVTDNRSLSDDEIFVTHVFIDKYGNHKKIECKFCLFKITYKYKYDSKGNLVKIRTKSHSYVNARKIKEDFNKCEPDISIIRAYNVDYKYDTIGKLIKEKHYTGLVSSVKIEHTENKFIKHYKQKFTNTGRLYSIVEKRKDSIKEIIEYDDSGVIQQNKKVYYSKDNLPFKEELYKKQYLIYCQINSFDSTTITQSVFKNYKNPVKSNNIEHTTRVEYSYDERGLLKSFDIFVNEELKNTRFFEYIYR